MTKDPEFDAEIAETDDEIAAYRGTVAYYDVAIKEELAILRAYSEAELIEYIVSEKGRQLLRVISDMSQHRQDDETRLGELLRWKSCLEFVAA